MLAALARILALLAGTLTTALLLPGLLLAALVLLAALAALAALLTAMLVVLVLARLLAVLRICGFWFMIILQFAQLGCEWMKRCPVWVKQSSSGHQRFQLGNT